MGRAETIEPEEGLR